MQLEISPISPSPYVSKHTSVNDSCVMFESLTGPKQHNYDEHAIFHLQLFTRSEKMKQMFVLQLSVCMS